MLLLIDDWFAIDSIQCPKKPALFTGFDDDRLLLLPQSEGGPDKVCTL